MKKKNKNLKIGIVALLALVAIVWPAAAQDTVHGCTLPRNYYSSFWMDHAYAANHYFTFTFDTRAPLYGWRHYTDSALTIYGLAVAMGTQADYRPNLSQDGQDTSHSGLQDEILTVWEMHRNTVTTVESLKVPVGIRPPDYYWDLQLPSASIDGDLPILPIYENYFDKPVVVEDSFIVGRNSVNNDNIHIACLKVSDSVEGAFLWYPNNGIYTFNTPSYSMEVHHYDDTIIYDTVETWSGWKRENGSIPAGFIVLFPILTPMPDTTHVGIAEMSPVERNTVVSPNPATGMVKVASGFGLQAVEVFDASGAKVHEQCASGMQTTLDVSRWPRGVYMLRVHTPMGIATKKLIVQ